MSVQFWPSFLAAHSLISHLQHAPSHLQRQAFIEQIASFLRKFLAKEAHLATDASPPLVGVFARTLALVGAEP